MQELERIFKEIDNLAYDFLGIEDYVSAGRVKMLLMKYMENDGWIPVEKSLPEVSEEMEYIGSNEFIVMIKGAKFPTALKYTQTGTWIDEHSNVYNVIAWRPLPAPYCTEKGV